MSITSFLLIVTLAYIKMVDNIMGQRIITN